VTLTLLLLGFVIGMRHAVETDHVAAVASLATRSHSVHDTVRQGAAWGLGHTLTLFLFGSVVLVLDLIMPERMAQMLEFMVGLMLVALGLDVLRRLIREKIHFHLHHHDDGEAHFHAHSHVGEEDHNPRLHDHAHPEGFPLRALLVGLMHGMAGSAALILLTLQTVKSPLLGLLYIALFGIGSMLGMALLSIIIAIPLRYSARGMTWLHNGLQVVIGTVTVGVGALLVYRIGWTEHLLF
jgi:ABC-type nickel/cobalt efflux system permease component RcnA